MQSPKDTVKQQDSSVSKTRAVMFEERPTRLVRTTPFTTKSLSPLVEEGNAGEQKTSNANPSAKRAKAADSMESFRSILLKASKKNERTKKVQNNVNVFGSAQSFQSVLLKASKDKTSTVTFSQAKKSPYDFLGKFDFEKPKKATFASVEDDIEGEFTDEDSIANISDSSSMSEWSIPGNQASKVIRK